MLILMLFRYVLSVMLCVVVTDCVLFMLMWVLVGMLRGVFFRALI
jgi:hypothetical protein